MKKRSSKIFFDKSRFFSKKFDFSEKKFDFFQEKFDFSAKFDLGLSGVFSVARLGFSIFFEWQHCFRPVSKFTFVSSLCFDFILTVDFVSAKISYSYSSHYFGRRQTITFHSFNYRCSLNSYLSYFQGTFEKYTFHLCTTKRTCRPM